MFNALKKFTSGLVPNEYPSPAFFHTYEVLSKYTPDISTLQRRYAHWVFVCGEEQRGHKNDSLVPAAYGNTITGPVTAFTPPIFTLWKKRLGLQSFAIPLYNPKSEAPYNAKNMARSIRGELHLIRPEQFLILDKYKENGKVYDRIPIEISVPYMKTTRNQYATAEFGYRCTIIPAWMYVGVADYWAEHLDAGFHFTQVKTVNRHLQSGYSMHDFITYPYYHFTQDEYKT
jgi:hypothetical protein